MHQKPTIIYISGAPGSGKSTLSLELSAKLKLLHIASDLVNGGIKYTNKSQNDRTKSLFENFIPLMQFLAEKNISFIAEQVLQKGLSEKDILEKINTKANLINIHTICDNPVGRHLARELARIESGIDEVSLPKKDRIVRAQYHKDNLYKTRDPLDIDMPQLVVNTDNGYDPDLPEILKFINENQKNQKVVV